MIRKIFKFFVIIILLFLVILFPFIVEKILTNEFFFNFSFPIIFSEEIWFGFIASYIGAIGTVFLGIIALNQNRKYKELSDKSEERFIKLQEDIKELTQKNVDLIELNTKIERLKYYPILSDIHYSFWNFKKKNIINSFDLENDAFQISFSSYETEKKITDIFNQFYTFTYTFKNDSERTIRNFNCTKIITNNKNYEMGIWIYQSCDIKPGALLRCVYASKINLAESIISGEIESLTFKYNMENVIGERFQMQMDVYFVSPHEETPDFFVELSPISRI